RGCPGRIVDEYGDAAAAVVGRDGIEPAVAVKVSRGQAPGLNTQEGDHVNGKGAVAVAAEHAHVIRAHVDRGGVHLSVAGEVAKDDESGIHVRGEVACGAEVAQAVAEQHADVVGVGAPVRRHQVSDAVAIHIPRGDRHGRAAAGEVGRTLKVAGAGTHQHLD